MAGVKKLIKETQKMQQKVAAVQEALAEKEIEVSAGGGAVTITITGQQEIRAVRLDPDLLKEDRETVEEILLTALQDATAKAKEVYEKEMESVTGNFSLPGLF